MKSISLMKKFSLVFVMLVLLLMSAPIVLSKEMHTQPNKIIIPSIQTELEVKPANIVFDTWEVRYDAASFGESSALPGEKGNTVIFSHAIPSLFGNLPAVETGDTIHVFTDLDWFTYKVTKKAVIEPENVEILNQVYPYQLTLYTCTGPEYSQRFVITAELQANTISSLF